MRTLCVLALAMLVALPVAAEPLPGSPAEGLRLARDQCAGCHYVDAEWSGLVVGIAPDFVEVAATPGINERSLRIFFQTPHIDMPNIILSPEQTDNVIAYILSLQNGQ